LASIQPVVSFDGHTEFPHFKLHYPPRAVVQTLRYESLAGLQPGHGEVLISHHGRRKCGQFPAVHSNVILSTGGGSSGTALSVKNGTRERDH